MKIDQGGVENKFQAESRRPAPPPEHQGYMGAFLLLPDLIESCITWEGGWWSRRGRRLFGKGLRTSGLWTRVDLNTWKLSAGNYIHFYRVLCLLTVVGLDVLY